MTSEERPLLSDGPPIAKRELVYERFSPGYKKFILSIVGWCGLMPLFISGTFYPSIPQIAKDLNTSGGNISFAVSLSVLATSIGSLTAAGYSTFYGRRPVYLIALPFSVIGSIGVAGAQKYSELLFWRFWQTFGAAPGFAVGGGVVGDIYKLEERGTAMGFFLAATLLGPALAPPVGGFAARYASWRAMQLSLGVFGFITFVIMFMAFPETSHPGTRGIDKLQQPGSVGRRWLPVFVNPLKPLGLLRSPNIFCVAIAGFFFLLTDYTLLVPLAYTIGKRYGIDNAALIGACFFPCGLGNIVGAPIAGRISDRIVIHWREKRGGLWYPEDRLRATLSGALIFAPLSVLGCGLVTAYIKGPIGLSLNLILLFFNGLGVDIVLSPCAAYTVDIMRSRSAEVMACNNGIRSFLLTFAIAGIFPMINTHGLVAANALSAVLAWVGFLLLLATVRFGNEMRAQVDVGYSTAENN